MVSSEHFHSPQHFTLPRRIDGFELEVMAIQTGAGRQHQEMAVKGSLKP
jgi:hypothetical protein